MANGLIAIEGQQVKLPLDVTLWHLKIVIVCGFGGHGKLTNWC